MVLFVLPLELFGIFNSKHSFESEMSDVNSLDLFYKNSSIFISGASGVIIKDFFFECFHNF
jgi:hypothetical protein